MTHDWLCLRPRRKRTPLPGAERSSGELLPETGRLRGYARPIFPGANVALQRFNGSSWRTIARALIDESGSFEASVDLVPGDYRARLAPGRGFVPGVSPTLTVGPA